MLHLGHSYSSRLSITAMFSLICLPHVTFSAFFTVSASNPKTLERKTRLPLFCPAAVCSESYWPINLGQQGIMGGKVIQHHLVYIPGATRPWGPVFSRPVHSNRPNLNTWTCFLCSRRPCLTGHLVLPVCPDDKTVLCSPCMSFPLTLRWNASGTSNMWGNLVFRDMSLGVSCFHSFFAICSEHFFFF